MAKIKPFRAIRPTEELASKVASLPYDVMNRDEAAELAKENPFSYLYVDRAEIQFSRETNPYSLEVYEKAKETLQKMLAEETLVWEDQPCFYIYQLQMDGRTQSGIVCCTSVEEYEQNLIKKHEFTRPEKEQDRIRHMDTCNADTSPVFLTYRKTEEIDAFVENYQKSQSPLYDFTSEDGITHKVWRIESPKMTEKLVAMFGKVPALYIADGHHRAASAYKVAQKRVAEAENPTENAPYNTFLSVLFPSEQLYIMDYNRLVKYPTHFQVDDFLSAVEKDFIVEPISINTPYLPKTLHEFGLYTRELGWCKVTPKASIIDESDPTARLDVSILQDHLLAPILEIEDPRTSKNIDFVGGIRGLSTLQSQVDEGVWDVAFALFPTSIDDVMTIADENLVMPPKSTWFEPKLRSGLFIYSLEEQ